MSRHRIGSRKKSIQASQYRVGRYGRIAAGRVQRDQHLAGHQHGERAHRGAQRRVGQRRQEQRDRADPEHRHRDVADRAEQPQRPARSGSIVTPDSDVTSAGGDRLGAGAEQRQPGE